MLVAAHPNAHVYSQLTSLVDFDGYYLESDPCLVCNDPEVPFTVREREAERERKRKRERGLRTELHP